MYAYNLNVGALTEFFDNSDNILGITKFKDKLLVVKDGDIFVLREDDKKIINSEIETGFISLKNKSRTTDAILDRLPLTQYDMDITNENGDITNYTFDENVFKIDLAKGQVFRYIKIRLYSKFWSYTNKLGIILKEEATL